MVFSLVIFKVGHTLTVKKIQWDKFWQPLWYIFILFLVLGASILWSNVSPFGKVITFYGCHHDLVDRYGICVTNDHGYVLLVVNTSRSFPRSRLITGFVTRLTQQAPLVEQELLNLPEHPSSPPIFMGFVLLDL